MRRHFILGALLLVGAVPVFVPATAQTKENDSISGVETVTVTARRRSEDEQKVPAAITPISGEELRITGTHSAIDLQTLAPSLTVTGDLGSRDTDVFTIRGQSQPFGGADPGVQTYFAEVPFNASGRGTDYDLQDVQVLNGPQGTLFGRNTTGGAILFEPKRPDDQFGGYLDVSTTNYIGREAQAAVNIPLDDTLYIRVAGDIADRKGFTREVYDPVMGASGSGENLDNINYQAFRVGIDWKPTDRFDNYAVFDYLNDRNNGTGAKLTSVNTSTLDALAGQFLGGSCPTVNPTVCGALAGFESAMEAELAFQNSIGPRATTSNNALGYRRKSWGATDIATFDVTPDIQLKNIFAYRVNQEQPSFDYDGSALSILEIPNSRTWESNSYQLTEEFQVLGQTDDKRLNWILGFYHESDRPNGYSQVERETFGGAQYSLSPFYGFGNTEIDELNNGGTSNAVYGSVTFDASDWVHGLSFTTGGRYTWDHKIADSKTCITIDITESCPYPLVAIPDFVNVTHQSANFHAPTWTLAANYQVTDDTMVYATYRRGYKSGGFNSGAGAATEFGEFKPEYLTDVELGTKNNWTILGVPGRTNFDAYYGWYDDVQKNDEIGIEQVILDPPNPPTTLLEPAALTFNAARATVKGLEFQSTFIPNENVEFSIFCSYTDASYNKFVLPQAIEIYGLGGPETILSSADHAGNPFAYTPKNKLGLSGRFHLPIDPAHGAPYVSAQWYWQSREWFTDLSDEEPDAYQGSYSVINLRLDWDNFMGSPVDLAVFANNVTNKTYKVAANALEHLTGTTSSIYGEPRIFGVEARVRFGEDAQP